MQKNETGLLSTIKKFIRGNAVKVGENSKPKLFYWSMVKLHLLLQSAPNSHNWNILFAATHFPSQLQEKQMALLSC